MRGSERQVAGLRRSAEQAPGSPPDIVIAKYIDRELTRAGLSDMKAKLDELVRTAVTEQDIDAALEAIKQRNITKSTATVSAAVVDNTYGAEEAGVITSLRTKVNEMNTVLNTVIDTLRAAGITA